MQRVNLTVADGQTVSAGVDIRTLVLWRNIDRIAFAALETPATLEATTVSFQMSTDGGTTYKPLYDKEGDLLTVTVGTSRIVALPPSTFPVMPTHIKAVLGTAASGATRTVALWLRAVL